MLCDIYMYQTASDISMVTMCASPLYPHVSPNWKYVFHCLEKCPRIDIPSHESDKQPENIYQPSTISNKPATNNVKY